MKKTFMTLAWIVGFVCIAALALNVLMPNVTEAVVDGAEGMLYNATGMKFDFNQNGVNGEQASNGDLSGSQAEGAGDDKNANAGIQGFGENNKDGN